VTPADYALLVVDDSEDNRYTLTRRLAREGYTRVATAEDGRQALALLREQPFDLVLLDIMMPELNGYEVLERLKADERLRHIPVIMISAVDQIESVIRCIELGAEDYLPKPFNPTLLRARVGATLEKKRLRDEIVAYLDRIERELASAREIQLSMVPTEFPGPTAARPVEIHATLQPARQVGGDLYDFFWRDTRTLCFVVADVSDKGAPAALFMARTKTVIRLVTTLLSGRAGEVPGPHEIIARVNQELCRDNAYGMFVTLFFGMLDVMSGELQFCNAGHNVPYVVGPTGIVPLHGARAKPVGIRPTLPYESTTTKLAPGECVFVFTDGITESMNGDGAFFSEERLEAALHALAGQAPRAIVEGVMARVREFGGGAPQSDDIAAMALRRAT
jgi:sigma-B regulation protein RsbU (phosphoserine phosphatase)